MRENKSNLALMYRFVLAFTVVLNEKRIIASEGMNEMQHMYIYGKGRGAARCLATSRSAVRIGQTSWVRWGACGKGRGAARCLATSRMRRRGCALGKRRGCAGERVERGVGLCSASLRLNCNNNDCLKYLLLLVLHSYFDAMMFIF